LAIAKTIASPFILRSASGASTRSPDSPTIRSVPSMTSAGVPSRRSGLVCSAYQRLMGDIDLSA